PRRRAGDRRARPRRRAVPAPRLRSRRAHLCQRRPPSPRPHGPRGSRRRPATAAVEHAARRAGGCRRPMTELYDRIGRTYNAARRADPRIQAAIERALGDARTVLNVGAGTGNYEPGDREVLAVEPSQTMIAQRPPGL